VVFRPPGWGWGTTNQSVVYFTATNRVRLVHPTQVVVVQVCVIVTGRWWSEPQQRRCPAEPWQTVTPGKGTWAGRGVACGKVVQWVPTNASNGRCVALCGAAGGGVAVRQR